METYLITLSTETLYKMYAYLCEHNGDVSTLTQCHNGNRVTLFFNITDLIFELIKRP